MIEKSIELARRINEEKPSQGGILIWWLGQSGFIIKSERVCIGIDLYLSTTLENSTRDEPEKRHVRMMPIAVSPDELNCLDYIICTHAHRDHYDAATVRSLLIGSPDVKLLAPYACASIMRNDGFDHVHIAGVDEPYITDGFSVSAIPSKHNMFDYNEKEGYPYVGYFMQFGGIKVYHAGDTILYDGLCRYLAHHAPDLAILPINGGTPDLVKIGFQSNLNYREAVDLSIAAEIPYMIPCHFDMFTINTEQLSRFVNYANGKTGLSYWAPVIGDPCCFSKEGFS